MYGYGFRVVGRMTDRLRGTFWLRLVLAVARRPRLWVVAVVQIFRLACPAWWRKWPPLPRPDSEYLRFRLETAYGQETPPEPIRVQDVITYLQWCREFPRP